MKQFMMIFRNKVPKREETFTKEQMQIALSEWQNWIRSIAAQGKYVGTNRLFAEGKVIQKSGVTEGPHVEKDVIVAGYLLVEANSPEEAIEMAKYCPNLVYGLSVEVRSVMPIEYDVNAKDFLEIVSVAI